MPTAEPENGARLQSVFQPIVDLATGLPLAHESLTRLTTSENTADIHGLLKAARANGSEWETERDLRRTVLDHLSAHAEPAHAFMNCSPRVLNDPRFPETLDAELRDAGVRPERVTIEITEFDHAGGDEAFRDRIESLRGRGLGIAIDDVGMGASGLGRILLLRPDWIKLDAALVTNLADDVVRQNLVRFMVRFGAVSGIGVIAEGVESEHDLRTLASLGVRYVQGFIFAAPGAPAACVSDDARQRARHAWSLSEDRTMRATTADSLSAPAFELDADCSHREASAKLLPTRAAGAVVVQEGAPIGWMPREALMAYARSGRAHEPLASSVLPDQSPIDPAVDLAHAIKIAAERDEQLAAYPLIVHASRGARIVSVASLLAAASESSIARADDPPAAIRLPGRLRLRARLAAYASVESGPSGTTGFDVACIESTAGGFSDKACACVVDSLLDVVRDETEIFISQESESRFVILAPVGRLDGRLGELAQRLSDETESHAAIPRILLARAAPASAAEPQHFAALLDAIRQAPSDEPLHGCDYVDILASDAMPIADRHAA
ncbi:MAG: EAL domain-containing protein [Planctomycetota bacterium]